MLVDLRSQSKIKPVTDFFIYSSIVKQLQVNHPNIQCPQHAVQTANFKGKVSAFYKIWYFIEAVQFHAVKSVQTLFEISL